MKTKQQSYPKLASTLGLDVEVYLKREDLHKYGSHKGRSIPAMIKEYHREGLKNFVVSSSGNAALAAILAVTKHNQNNSENKIGLTVFIGNKIDPNKKEQLERLITNRDPLITVQQVERPKQSAFQLDKSGEAKFLRQSTDDSALTGYTELSEELGKIPNLQAIFIPTSSGTTAEGIGKGFETLDQNPQIHIVQTSSCHPIAEEFDNSSKTIEEKSIAGAIVDNIAHRKQSVIDVIKNSNGSGWIVTNKEIKEAIEIIKKTAGIDISTNSALSIAGLKKAQENGFLWDGSVVCIITGH